MSHVSSMVVLSRAFLHEYFLFFTYPAHNENTQNIPHISKLLRLTRCAIKNHSGVKTCRVADTRAQQLPHTQLRKQKRWLDETLVDVAELHSTQLDAQKEFWETNDLQISKRKWEANRLHHNQEKTLEILRRCWSQRHDPHGQWPQMCHGNTHGHHSRKGWPSQDKKKKLRYNKTRRKGANGKNIGDEMQSWKIREKAGAANKELGHIKRKNRRTKKQQYKHKVKMQKHKQKVRMQKRKQKKLLERSQKSRWGTTWKRQERQVKDILDIAQWARRNAIPCYMSNMSCATWTRERRLAILNEGTCSEGVATMEYKREDMNEEQTENVIET